MLGTLIFAHLLLKCSMASADNLLGTMTPAPLGKKTPIGDTFVFVDEPNPKRRSKQKQPKARLFGVAVLRDNRALTYPRLPLRRPNVNYNNGRNKRRRGRGRNKNKNKKVTKNKNAQTLPTTKSGQNTPEFSGPLKPDEYDYRYEEYGFETTRRRLTTSSGRRRRTQTAWSTWPSSQSTSTLTTTTTTPMASEAQLVTVTSPSVPPVPSTFCASDSLNVAMICCNMQFPALFDYADFDNCATNAANLSPEEMDTFLINYGMDEKSELNFNLKWFQDARESMCVMSCVFLESEFMGNDPRVLDTEEVNSYFDNHLENTNKSEWISTLDQALVECEEAIKVGRLTQKMPDFFETEDSTCFTRPFLYVQCIRRELLYNCPEPSEKALSDDNCKSVMTTLGECNPFNT
ncbi:Hypothetical predicted protein [Cloeon dipterum]|uniref:Uncharacterized protein n=1 Tax=Cloeon dipterum TaxID=197152 RepID=A0A8S1DN61_9INSE|nr:Hypothetical predicted protein [Cloeon dipterum]